MFSDIMIHSIVSLSPEWLQTNNIEDKIIKRFTSAKIKIKVCLLEIYAQLYPSNIDQIEKFLVLGLNNFTKSKAREISVEYLSFFLKTNI